MKNPLKRFTIAITGDFGKARSLDKLKQWIETNGGVFATKVGSEVTHLICSTEHYKKSVAMGMSNSCCYTLIDGLSENNMSSGNFSVRRSLLIDVDS